MQLEELLTEAVRYRASDLFITVGTAPAIKVSGRFVPLAEDDLDSDQTQALVDAALTPEQRERFARTGEANCAIRSEHGERFRVSAFYQRGAPGMVARRIESHIPSLEQLRLPPKLHELARLKRGLILFVGGTGTGKSSSLAAMIGSRNATMGGHILTVEDPIEFIHPHQQSLITQREVGIDTDSFEVALRNALRQAPDVILIGEVRSREVMDYAVAFAETGHLTLATLHANNANQALDRIINFFPQNRREQLLMDLSLNLEAIVAQQLVPTADGAGRVPAIELLLGSPLVKTHIRNGEIDQLKEVMGKSEEMGMQTFDRHLFQLYQAGEITYENALAHADSANDVRLMIKLDGQEPDTGDSEKQQRRGPSFRLK